VRTSRRPRKESQRSRTPMRPNHQLNHLEKRPLPNFLRKIKLQTRLQLPRQRSQTVIKRCQGKTRMPRRKPNGKQREQNNKKRKQTQRPKLLKPKMVKMLRKVLRRLQEKQRKI